MEGVRLVCLLADVAYLIRDSAMQEMEKSTSLELENGVSVFQHNKPGGLGTPGPNTEKPPKPPREPKPPKEKTPLQKGNTATRMNVHV